MNRIKNYLGNRLEQIREIRETPQAVAGGVAIGLFWGFTPLLGVKTLLSIFFAWLARCSKLSAALTVALHDTITPIWPVILRWEYDLGFWVLSQPHRFPPRFAPREFHLAQWLHLKALEILWPTFIGSLFFAVPIAAISYWGVERSLLGYQRRHHCKVPCPH